MFLDRNILLTIFFNFINSNLHILSYSRHDDSSGLTVLYEILSSIKAKTLLIITGLIGAGTV